VTWMLAHMRFAQLAPRPTAVTESSAWPSGLGHLSNPRFKTSCQMHLFTLNDRSKVSKVHRATCTQLGLVGFRLHDARHHWAVRAARAAQLGHVDATMVLRVYVGSSLARTTGKGGSASLVCRIVPPSRRLYYRRYYTRGYGAQGTDAIKPPNHCRLTACVSSRGGTRTRDPGIMRNGASPCPPLSAYRTTRPAPRNPRRATVHSARLSARHH
jgi:hypothetical protein